MEAYIKLLRPHQWAKNTLLFVAAALAHHLLDASILQHVVPAFIAFCLTASAGYVINDVLDVDADKLHPRKRFRPIASGKIRRGNAIVYALCLLVVATVIALYVSTQFMAILGAYLVGTLLYSIWLKRYIILDVVILSALYTIRIIAGGIAADVVITTWLLGFSLFLFTSLAFMKRYVELRDVPPDDSSIISRRGYRASDIQVVSVVGPAIGLLAILVLALYINSPQVRVLYSTPGILWLLVPLLVYWICKVWVEAFRGNMHDDPVAYAISDRLSLLCGACALMVIVAAAWK